MTLLILDPCTLSETLPNASLSSPVRVRLIAQVVEYIDHEYALVIRPVNNLIGAESNGTVKVRLPTTNQPLDRELTSLGTIVQFDAFYDGSGMTVISCGVVDSGALMRENGLEVMRAVASLERI
ncbi:uncharacterized protein CANTADRAFT_7092 [Suhomyces tanzawaensis NRRL Y-17324]|uniref:Uncharacterized protein n=1 Tax=Suhomyces tanzawaensis NRRL Y-17324 TaxID=984487 RepID=A0A1E4SH04_9ASCO|nr:uncharacterized protein CANTADRAFT_7092 [Suhomyces tanzawaensis NRRL Y-17324]ODV78750.1 hypothetical protein CANTADRAFT_7092 [Suhomyces tanzawaensis NRRL Y-17324]